MLTFGLEEMNRKKGPLCAGAVTAYPQPGLSPAAQTVAQINSKSGRKLYKLSSSSH